MTEPAEAASVDPRYGVLMAARANVAPAVLEDAVHAINAHIRGAGVRDLVVWPANTDEMAHKLAALAEALGGEAFLGTSEPIRRFFSGPPSDAETVARRSM